MGSESTDSEAMRARGIIVFVKFIKLVKKVSRLLKLKYLFCRQNMITKWHALFATNEL